MPMKWGMSTLGHLDTPASPHRSKAALTSLWPGRKKKGVYKTQLAAEIQFGHFNDFHWAVCNYALFKLQIRSNSRTPTNTGKNLGEGPENLNSKQAEKQARATKIGSTHMTNALGLPCAGHYTNVSRTICLNVAMSCTPCSVFRFDFQNVKYIKRAFALGLVAIWWHNQPQRGGRAAGLRPGAGWQGDRKSRLESLTVEIYLLAIMTSRTQKVCALSVSFLPYCPIAPPPVRIPSLGFRRSICYLLHTFDHSQVVRRGRGHMQHVCAFAAYRLKAEGPG